MKYICKVCGYTYDDSKEKVPFKDLPENWTCPLCGAPKSMFEPLEEKKDVKSTTKTTKSQNFTALIKKEPAQRQALNFLIFRLIGLIA